MSSSKNVKKSESQVFVLCMSIDKNLKKQKQ